MLSIADYAEALLRRIFHPLLSRKQSLNVLFVRNIITESTEQYLRCRETYDKREHCTGVQLM